MPTLKQTTALHDLKERLQVVVDDLKGHTGYYDSGYRTAVENVIKDIDAQVLEKEKQQLCDFWIEGNKQGWEQQTDRPDDAEKFYNSTFQSGKCK